MKIIHLSRAVIVAAALGAVAGRGVTWMAVNPTPSPRTIAAKDAQILALTAAVTQLQQQLTSDAMTRAEAEKRLKAFNTLPTSIAPPQTFQGGFQ